MTDGKKGIVAIVDRLPPPGKLRSSSSAEPAADDGGDYSAAEDSMSAFMEALKGDDVGKALDAWDDVKKNC